MIESVSSPAKRFEDAIEYYGKAIALDPSVAAYYGNRSFSYLKMESYGFALADASKALELDKGYIKVISNPPTPLPLALSPLAPFPLSLPPFHLTSSHSPHSLHPSSLSHTHTHSLSSSFLPLPSNLLCVSLSLPPSPSNVTFNLCDLGVLPSCQCQHGSGEVQAGLEGLRGCEEGTSKRP